MAITITTGNFKGGVGKTTNAVMLSYQLAMKGYKTLLVDLDPQANATDMLTNTMISVFNNTPEIDLSIGQALINGNLSEAIISFSEKLDFLPSYTDLQNYEKFLFDNFPDDYSQDFYFINQLDLIKSNYDYIIIDVPPQLNKFTDSALVASDYVVVILQTQERSLRGAEKYIEHLLFLSDEYKLTIDIAGILAVLVQNGSELDLDVISDAIDSFGESNLFSTKIKQMARLKRYDRQGITNNPHDIHDIRAHKVYSDLAIELEHRIDVLKGAQND